MANKILLADDSPTIAKILGMALQSENYQIRSVLTADDAEKELRSNPPDFFLVDLTLPGKNGYEFANLIRGDSKLKNVKIVLLSSAFDPADEAEVEKCGADGVIAKPFDPSDLREKLRNLANTPIKFPKGSRVEGAISGTNISAPSALDQLATSPSFPTVQIDPLDLQLSQTRPLMPAADPDAILSSALSGLDGQGTAGAGNFLQSSGNEPSDGGIDLLGQQLGQQLGNENAKLDLGSTGPNDSFITPASLEGGLSVSLDSGTEASSLPSTLDSGPPPVSPELQSANIDALLSAGLPPEAEGSDERQPTLQLDLGSSLANLQQEASVLDLSESFHGGSETPTSPPPKIQVAPTPAKKLEDPNLSPNAQALAAFFEAEIDAKSPSESAGASSSQPSGSIGSVPPPLSIPGVKPKTPPMPATAASSKPAGLPSEGMESADSFDASLGSIEWGESPKNLNAWSSGSVSSSVAGPGSGPGNPKKSPPLSKPAPLEAASLSTPPFGTSNPSSNFGTFGQERQNRPDRDSRSLPSGAVHGEGSFLFDTGGSNFRFAEDYIHRITKSFTGSPDEMVLGKDPSPPKPSPIFPRTSSDSNPPAQARTDLPPAHPGSGRGAWTPEEEQRIEQLVKEEVQMVVREIAERVAWEVIPELAENIIRKELDKVLKEMEE